MKEKFEIHLDKTDDVVWFLLKTGPIEYYEEVEAGLNLEFEDDNTLMGIEILHASEFLSYTKKDKNSKVYYEAEDDVLNIWVSRKPFDYAEQYGDFIIHFSKSKKPVHIEILNYSKYLKSSNKKVLPEAEKQHSSAQSIAHRVK